ncbi:hypothetical protein HY440_01895 [Candidatus Microgenomates bacterium]|nr:hypothetical protein [Candidatus Microgenomates bacterium]
MVLIWVIMAIACTLPLYVIVAYHQPTLRRFWRLLTAVDLIILLIWLFGDSVAMREQLWKISFDSFTGHQIFGSQVGNIFWFAVINFIISTVTIIMWQADQKRARFRDVFFKKE